MKERQLFDYGAMNGNFEIAYYLWFNEPPTQPGHYHAIDKLGRGVWVDVRKVKDRIYVDYGDGNAVELSNFVCWLGPLPEPEPPKGYG